jgi:hypothetical protein
LGVFINTPGLTPPRPGFNESYHGFRSFNQLLEEAQARKLIELEKDEKSGGYVVKAVGN